MSLNVAKAAILKNLVRQPYAWPGGYEKFVITKDGGSICHKCCAAEFKGMLHSTLHSMADGWECEMIWDAGNIDGPLHCDHCAAVIVE